MFKDLDVMFCEKITSIRHHTELFFSYEKWSSARLRSRGRLSQLDVHAGLTRC